MEIFLAIIFLLIGFLLLTKGADWFVEGTSKMAVKMHIPEIVVGLTIVAMGTSAPEAAISINAGLHGNAGISVGNVIGSNILNVAIILGIAALIAKLPIKNTTIKYEIPFVIIVTVLLMGIGYIWGGINKIGAIILIVFFFIYLAYLYWLARHGEDSIEGVDQLTNKDTYIHLFVITLVGMAAIIFGSDLTVDSATTIAKALGLSDRVIGLTIIAFGTSLPELVTSVTAARRGNTDIAIGNIIGSNIFNILFVLGLSGMVSPSMIPFASNFFADGFVAILVLLLLFIFCYKEHNLNKKGGIILLVVYFVYLITLLI